ncbi:MAG: helix-turn-helix domain-containing protein [Candidatus Omnitrophota bacterium]
MPKNKDILTAKQVAEYLHLHPLTVHRYAREGKIPAFKIGTDWRFYSKYLERWIKQKHGASSVDKKSKNNELFDKK